MQIVQAKTLQEATVCLADGDAKILAGGTDLSVEYRRQLPHWRRLVHIGYVPELTQISITDDKIEIGAAVTYTRIADEPCADAGYAALRDAALTIGSPGIMNFGTLGGNLGTASPAGDGSLALLALAAEIVVSSDCGERKVPISEFFLGPRKSVLQPDEIVRSVCIHRGGEAKRCAAFGKIGNRDGSVLSVVSAAVVLEFSPAGICTKAHVAFGAAAPVPKRAPTVESELIGSSIDTIAEEYMEEAIAEDISPIDDQRSKAWYRREIASVLLSDVITAGVARIQDGI